MTSIGVAFDGMTPVAAAIRMARRAERRGLESIWIAEHLGFRESMLTSLAVLQATRSLRVVPTALSPFMRHPTLLAMAVATLAEYGNNRLSIAIGVGNPLSLSESGVSHDRPIAFIREYMACLRLLFSGAPARYDGKLFTLNGARLSLDDPIAVPIYVAATGPQMLRLAGRRADGVVLSSGLSPLSTIESLNLVAEAALGQRRLSEDVRTAGYVITAVSRDGRVAVEACRTKLAFVLRNRQLAGSVTASGIPLDHEGIVAAVGRRDLDAARRLVSDEAVAAFTIAGTPTYCSRQLSQYVDTGVGEIVLSLAGPAENHDLALRLAREVGGGKQPDG
jgi:5,10-methylenetetrahydromethanopterin reductase